MREDGQFPLSVPLINSSGVKHTVRLEYEYIPDICHHRGMFLHEEMLCKLANTYRHVSHPTKLAEIIPPSYDSFPVWSAVDPVDSEDELIIDDSQISDVEELVNVTPDPISIDNDFQVLATKEKISQSLKVRGLIVKK